MYLITQWYTIVNIIFSSYSPLNIRGPRCAPLYTMHSLLYPLPVSSFRHIFLIHLLAEGRPILHFPIHGLHSRTCFSHRLWVFRQVWPAHLHFSLLILRAMLIFLLHEFHLSQKLRAQYFIDLSEFKLTASRIVGIRISAPAL